MAKKWNCFSIKRVRLASKSKEKPLNEAEKRSWKEKKSRGRLKHGSLIPFSRKPSSIEKILGEVDQQNLFIPQLEAPPPSSFSGRSLAPNVASPPKPPAASSPPRPRAESSSKQTETIHRPELTLLQQNLLATRIQAAYRGYMARRKVRGMAGVRRLQGLISGQNVRRQTVNAVKRMQLLVRVQTQIRSLRIQTLENQALKRQANKQLEPSNANKLLEMGDENWDDSFITKEEREARVQKRVEAAINRDRAMAYAYSHKLSKARPKSSQNSLMDIRSGGYLWLWNSLEHQLPTDTLPTSDHKQLDSPMSSRSKQMTPSRISPSNHLMRYSINKARRGSSSSSYPMKDDDSLKSCPPFSVPHYMSPTVSAKAKARPAISNPNDRGGGRAPSTPGSVTSNRRFSFPQSPNGSNRSFKWNHGDGSRNNKRSVGSIGDLSVDSAISVPAAFGRKPFNRFV